MSNNFNNNANKKNLNGSDISYTTYRTNYPNNEAMKENGGVPSSGGDTKVSTNINATIDVSTYTEPVEIEPTEGYDATEKVTVTLTNIPSGGGQPSLEVPSWLNDENVSQSVVPSGVKCPLIYVDSGDNETLYSITGDGTATVAELVQGLSLTYDTIRASGQYIYYDNSVEFEAYQPK